MNLMSFYLLFEHLLWYPIVHELNQQDQKRGGYHQNREGRQQLGHTGSLPPKRGHQDCDGGESA